MIPTDPGQFDHFVAHNPPQLPQFSQPVRWEQVGGLRPGSEETERFGQLVGRFNTGTPLKLFIGWDRYTTRAR